MGWIGVIGLGWYRGGRAFCCVSPARVAGSSLTFAKRPATPILGRAGRTEMREISALASGRVGVSPAAKSRRSPLAGGGHERRDSARLCRGFNGKRMIEEFLEN